MTQFAILINVQCANKIQGIRINSQIQLQVKTEEHLHPPGGQSVYGHRRHEDEDGTSSLPGEPYIVFPFVDLHGPECFTLLRLLLLSL